MRFLAVFVTALLLCGSALANTTSPRVQFTFYNGFLMNLHHFLYDSASLDGKRARPEWQHVTDADDLRILGEATAFYKANYASRDLLFDEGMNRIKMALSVADDRLSADGLALPAELAALLNRAAPAYARTLWPLHAAANRRWIRQAAALDATFGAQIEAVIERLMAHPFPARPIRIDVVYQTGTWAGAYTSEAPMQAVLPSARADYQGLAALEMLYHEAAHIDANTAIIAAIDANLKASGRPADTGLWHAVHFYTVGHAVRDVLGRHAIAYQPYGERNGVYKRGFAAFMPAIETAWLPWLQGRSSFATGASEMVGRLPPP
jgi:hypothetical protein